MSKSAERAKTPVNSIVRNTADKGSKEVTEGPPGFLPDDKLREICEKTLQQNPADHGGEESIDSYDALRKAFLGNFLQQNKYIKDPVEIHHIKQREEESTKAFMKCFKAKSRYVNGASECMSISGFMHGITNPDLIKHLNDNILKLVDKMMGMTTTFLKGEVYPAYQDPKRDSSNGHGEIQGTPTKSGPAENMNKSKFYEFYRDKGHSTDEYIHLKKQLEEAVRSGQLSHLIKEFKKGNNKVDHTKTSKKGEAPNKEKAPAIFMVQP
ncbi:reverse transcriptase domain-containing protein [Tanacetum coccineum]